MLGVAVGAASTTATSAVGGSLARVVGRDSRRFGAFSALHGQPLPFRIGGAAGKSASKTPANKFSRFLYLT